MVDVTLNDL